MEVTWVEAAGLLATIFIAAGTVIRWLVTRMDKMHGADRQWDQDARDRLVTDFEQRLAALNAKFEAENKALQRTIAGQRDEVRFLQAELHRYIKHVGILEGILKSHSIEIPSIEPPHLPAHLTGR